MIPEHKFDYADYIDYLGDTGQGINEIIEYMIEHENEALVEAIGLLLSHSSFEYVDAVKRAIYKHYSGYFEISW